MEPIIKTENFIVIGLILLAGFQMYINPDVSNQLVNLVAGGLLGYLGKTIQGAAK